MGSSIRRFADPQTAYEYLVCFPLDPKIVRGRGKSRLFFDLGDFAASNARQSATALYHAFVGMPKMP